MNEQILYNRPLFPATLNMAHPLARGLVGCWVLNEEGGLRAFDSSPYGKHGLVTGAKGNYQGRTLNGTSDNIITPAFALNNNFTTQIVWMKCSDLTVRGTLLSRNNTAGLFMLEVGPAQGGGPTNMFSVVRPGVWSWQSQNNVLSNDVWALVGFTVNGNGEVPIGYLNGTLATPQFTGSAITMDSTSEILIIGSRAVGNQVFSGIIGGVWIYNRALTGQENKNLYLDPYGMFLR